MEIRRITRQDLPALTDLFKRSVFEIAGCDYTPAQCAAWTQNAENPQWAERFLSTWTIGAFIAEQLAGFANLESPTQLDCFYVHPDFQRQGVGSALFKAVSEQAQKAGAAFLESDISLTAEPFFRAQGWKVLHRNEIQREDQVLINTTMRFTFSNMENAINPKWQLLTEIHVQDRSPEFIDQLTRLWRASVKETHLFLSAEEIDKIQTYVPQALASIPHLILAEKDKAWIGFMGISEQKLEMLFLDPAYRKQGWGAALLTYAMNEYGVNELDVNEQNPQAAGFYEHLGFRVVCRRDTDDQGMPYPILTMRLLKGES